MSVLQSDLSIKQLNQGLDRLVGLVAENNNDAYRDDIPFNFDLLDLGNNLFEQAASSLRDNGVVVLRNYLPINRVDEVAAMASAFLERIGSAVANRQPAETADYVIPQSDDPRFANYALVSRFPKPVVFVRTGATDDGLVDIFNVNRLPGEWNWRIDPIRNAFVLGLVERAGGRAFTATNTNLYVNDSIVTTRGFHYDSDTPQMKAFLYLTDVTEEADGPYCYALGTHRSGTTRRLSAIIAQATGMSDHTDTPFFDKRRVRVLTGKRGTLIISRQAGIHRGFPQAPGRRRLALVQNFMPT